jgi:hypothetical protein
MMAAQAGPDGGRASGAEVLVSYRDPNPEWHARIVLARVGSDPTRVGSDVYVILTPDSDIYAEDLGASSREIQTVRDRPADRSVPFGVAADQVYDFAALPTAADLLGLVGEAQRSAQRQRVLMGIPDLAPVPAGPAARAAPAPLPPPLPPPALPPAGGLLAVPLAVAAPQAQPAAPVPAQGGLHALTAALGGPAAAQPVPFGGGVAPVPQPPVSALDIRVMTVRYDVAGDRYREFRECCQLIEQYTFPDCPVKGPSTVAWCCRFMLENGGTPSQWHARWKSLCKLQDSDAGVALHDVGCRAIEILMTYDQCQIGCLATGEFLARQVQMSEERWKDRVHSTTDAATSLDAHLYGGMISKGSLCICPALQLWIATELSKEASVAKERRKAREERQLAKPGKS